MGQVLTVMNMKGRGRKTTISCHLAGLAALSKLGRPQKSKVLLIDYDPQFNASQTYIESRKYASLENLHKTTMSILMDDPTTIDPFALQNTGYFPPPKVADLAHSIYLNEEGLLDIVPSTMDLMYVALGQPNRSITPIKRRFEEFIAEAKAKYDYVIIDCHPAGSIFTQTSLSCSDHVLIPVKPERYAVRGLGLMMRFINGRGPQRSAITPHILFNYVGSGPRSNEETEIRANARFAGYCVRGSVREWGHLQKPSEGRDFVWQRHVAYWRECMKNLEAVFSELLARITP